MKKQIFIIFAIITTLITNSSRFYKVKNYYHEKGIFIVSEEDISDEITIKDIRLSV